MPTENINIETQVQVDITRAALQALIAGNTVKKKLYHVTDAIGGTQKILVWSLTNSTTSFNAVNFTNGKFGRYYIGPDVFVAIVEGMGGVLSYNSFAVFPTTGLQNTIYIELSTFFNMKSDINFFRCLILADLRIYIGIDVPLFSPHVF